MKVVKVDNSRLSSVWVCLVCGTRGIAWDHLTALRTYRHHELRAHPGARDGLETLRQYARRHAADS